MKKNILILSIFFFNFCIPDVRYTEYWQYLAGEEGVHMPFKVYTLHDTHVGHEEVHPQQRKDILHFIKATNSSLIVEEDEKNKNTANIYQLYNQIEPEQLPLCDLSLLATHENIPTTNIDFSRGDTKEQCKQSANKQIEVIQEYDDPAVLTDYYKECIDQHQNIVAPTCRFLLDNLDNVDDPIVQERAKAITILYNPFLKLNKLTKKELKDELLVYYNTELVDLKMLHALSEHGKQTIKSTVIYAGAAHCCRIRSALRRLGYRLIKSKRLFPKNNGFFKLGAALHRLDPEYDPEEKLSKTMVDYLLSYLDFENEHPHLAIVIPTTVLIAAFTAIGYLAQAAICGNKG